MEFGGRSTVVVFWGQAGTLAPSMRRQLALAALFLAVGLTGCSKIEARDKIREGNEAYGDAQFEIAIEKYTEALELEPDGVTVLWNRAMAAESLVLQLKDATDPAQIEERHKYATMALEDLDLWNERREKTLPQDDGPQCGKRAEPEPEEGAPPEAKDKDDRDPDLVAYQDHRLAILGADSRCDDLIEHWRQLHQACPQNEDLYMTIAQTFEDICGKADKADEWYVKRTQDFPESPKAWYSLATRRFDPLFPDAESGLPFNQNVEAKRRIEIADEVIGYLETATKLDPKYRDPYVWKSMAHTQKSLAREFVDPPETTEDAILALIARRDSMLAWRETKAVCDIDHIPDCPAQPDPVDVFGSLANWKGRDIEMAGKVVDESVKEIDKYTWEFDLEVEYTPKLPPPPEGEELPPPPTEGEAPPVIEPVKQIVSVRYTFMAPEVMEGEEPIDISEQIASQVAMWKKQKSSLFVGQIDAKGEGFSLVVLEQPIQGCCPPAPLTPEEEKADAEQLKTLQAQLEAEKAAPEDPKGKGKKGKGK
jgi:tetratricopeptide (TPR) repeat protein